MKTLDIFFGLIYYLLGDFMEDINSLLDKDLLFDFYSELLSENQRRIYEEVVFNDYSISEIAKDEGISRQSVSDMIKRCDKNLMDYENKLHILKRFKKINELQNKLGLICENLIEEYGNKIDKAHIENLNYVINELDILHQ